jgi:hypothetical protein
MCVTKLRAPLAAVFQIGAIQLLLATAAMGQPCTWSDRTVGPGYRSYHAMCYDSVRHQTVMFGGIDLDYNAQTWEWNGTTWTPERPLGPADARATP